MKKVLNRFLSLVLLLGLACPAVLGQEGGNLRNLTVDDYFRMQRVSNPQISPEGKWIAFVISTMDLKKNFLKPLFNLSVL